MNKILLIITLSILLFIAGCSKTNLKDICIDDEIEYRYDEKTNICYLGNETDKYKMSINCYGDTMVFYTPTDYDLQLSFFYNLKLKLSCSSIKGINPNYIGDK